MKDEAKTKAQLIDELNELRKSETLYSALFEHNPIETIAVDCDGRIVKVNLVRRKSGDKPPQLGDRLYVDYAAKHKIDMRGALMKCIEKKEARKFPNLQYDNRFLSVHMSPFAEGAIVTSQDISKRKKAEHDLRESQEKYRSLVETMNEGLGIADENG